MIHEFYGHAALVRASRFTPHADPTPKCPGTRVAPTFAQECLHGPSETPDQAARRLEALTATRNVNNLEANQPGAQNGVYLRQVELASSPFAAKAPSVKKLNFTPGAELLPGWQLVLDVTQEGYWFIVKDKTDPCGFAYISNQQGLIFHAEPNR